MHKNVVNLLLLASVGCSANPSEQFIRDDSKEVVLDTATNLMWEDTSHAEEVRTDWYDAIDYCESLVLGGYNDWHLPNYNELFNLRDPEKYKMIDDTFKYVRPYFYWTSTTLSKEPGYAARVFFWDNDGFDDGPLIRPKTEDSYYVRCVRIADE